MVDPYETLGVAKTASQNEIKKAYRALAKKLHPDLNPGNKETEKKFKEISHAFDLIGTTEARAKFDRGETKEHEEARYEEFFKQRRGPFYSETQEGPEGGRYSYNFQNEFGDEDLFETIFGRRQGSGGRAGSGTFSGEDQLFQVEVDFVDAALGAERLITLPNGKKLQVKIPAGIEEGKRLRFKGQGSPGLGGSTPGDLYLEIKIRPKEGWSRSGKDLQTEVPISVFEAMSGGEIPVETLDGKVLLKVPAGSSTGMKLRVRGKGAGSEGDRGNLLVSLRVVVPKTPDPELVEEMRKVSQKYAYDPRMQ